MIKAKGKAKGKARAKAKAEAQAVQREPLADGDAQEASANAAKRH